MQRAAGALGQSMRAAAQVCCCLLCAPVAAFAHLLCVLQRRANARGFASSAAEEGDSRVMAYALGALGAAPFVALSPLAFPHVQRLAKESGNELPVRTTTARSVCHPPRLTQLRRPCS